MAERQVSIPQLAALALDLIARASVSADDATLEMTRAVRGVLRGIATGDLAVVQAQPPAPTSAPCRGSDGVVAPPPPKRGK